MGGKPLKDWIIEPLLLLGVSLEKKSLDFNIYSAVCVIYKRIIKVTQSWIFSKQINWHIDSRQQTGEKEATVALTYQLTHKADLNYPYRLLWCLSVA